MQIKMKTLYVNEKKIVEVGKIGQFSEEEGMALIRGGYGQSMEPVIEKAIIKTAEKMVRPKAKPKKKAKK